MTEAGRKALPWLAGARFTGEPERAWEWATEQVALIEAEATAAAEQRLRDALLLLHHKHTGKGGSGLCDECLHTWPCETFRILSGGSPATPGPTGATANETPPDGLPTPAASPRQGEQDRPARCAEEGCVRTPGHVGAHTSRPYWPRELRDELALEPFTKVVVGIYDPATQQTETIVGVSASPRQGEPVEGLDEAWKAAEAALPDGWTMGLGVWPRGAGAFSDNEGPYEATATRYDDDFTGPVTTADGPTPEAALRKLAAALSEPAEAGEP